MVHMDGADGNIHVSNCASRFPPKEVTLMLIGQWLCLIMLTQTLVTTLGYKFLEVQLHNKHGAPRGQQSTRPCRS